MVLHLSSGLCHPGQSDRPPKEMDKEHPAKDASIHNLTVKKVKK